MLAWWPAYEQAAGSHILCAVVSLFNTSPSGAQSTNVAEPSPAADWPTYNRDLAGTRYSPLKQINKDNVRNLEQVWSYRLGRNVTTGDLGGGSEFTPLVIGGVMYVAAADHIVALAPETGSVLWRVDTAEWAPPSRRGLAYWPAMETFRTASM